MRKFRTVRRCSVRAGCSSPDQDVAAVINSGTQRDVASMGELGARRDETRQAAWRRRPAERVSRLETIVFEAWRVQSPGGMRQPDVRSNARGKLPEDQPTPVIASQSTDFSYA
jgi:hypothetical protein